MSTEQADAVESGFVEAANGLNTYVRERTQQLMAQGLAEDVASGQAYIEGMIETLRDPARIDELVAAEAALKDITDPVEYQSFYEQRVADLQWGADYMEARLASEGAEYARKASDLAVKAATVTASEIGGVVFDAALVGKALFEGEPGEAAEGMAGFVAGIAAGALAASVVSNPIGIAIVAVAGSIAGGMAIKLTYDDMRAWMTNFFEVMGGLEGIWDSVADYYTSALTWTRPRDPLTLDLDGDGIETTSPEFNAGSIFDHNDDGVAIGTGWIAPDDGLLVLDRNGNGSIDDGTELFGDSTPTSDGIAEHGFAALADLDTNGDGRITAADGQFSDLRVWQDADSDGNTDAGELKSLDELGISGLDLAYEDVNKDLGGGNTLSQLGSRDMTADDAKLRIGV